MLCQTMLAIGCLVAITLSVNAIADGAPQTRRNDESHRLLSPPDLASIPAEAFSDEEQDIPYYLVHFHKLANAVIMEGEDRGFIDLPVWRRAQDNRPYNHRVLENHVAFAFFYCTDRPWNPYYRDARVRARLEAILDFWARTQHPEGMLREYQPDNWNLAATSFGVQMMSETLRLLRDGPPIDPELHQRVIDGTRRAIEAILTRDDFWRQGSSYSNQYSGSWGGAMLFLSMYPDERLSTLLRQRIEQSIEPFGSPAGYPYEADGCDWGYTLDTHHNNVLHAWTYSRETQLARPLIETERRWTDWLSYNAVLEPDGGPFILNRGIESRTPLTHFATWSSPVIEHVPAARAFARTQEQVERSLRQRRQRHLETWPQVPELRGYNPHFFVGRTSHRTYPAAGEREQALASLPYLANDRFIHQRMDDRHPAVYTFIRRPVYYAAFNSGPVITPRQRLGLGLLWHPRGGTLLQSQAGARREAWGTAAGPEHDVYEARGALAEFSIDDQAIEPEPGVANLPDGMLTVTYPLQDQGRKHLAFDNRRITVTVEHDGPFIERIPLLRRREDLLELLPGRLNLRRGEAVLAISFDAAIQPELIETDLKSGPCDVIVLELAGHDRLEYELAF
jgi:hypothetical protein